MSETTTRTLSAIAAEIRSDWTKPSPYAIPYLDALSTLTSVTDRYFYEDGKTMVLYFLSNATTWRGPVARRVKRELKDLAGIK